MPLWASLASWFTPTVLFCLLNLIIGTIFITSNFMSSHKKQQQQHHYHHHGEKSFGQPLARAPSILERIKSINLALYEPQPQHQQQLSGMDTNTTISNINNSSSAQLARAPSLLERVKSINLGLYGYGFESQPQPEPQQPFAVQASASSSAQLDRAPSLLERVKSFNWSPYRPEHPDPFTHDPSETVQSRREPENERHDSDHHVTRSKSDESGNTLVSAPAKIKKSASDKKTKKEEEEDGEDFDRRRAESVTERQVNKGRETASFFGEDEGVDEKADDFINRFRQQLKLQRLDSLLRYKQLLNRGAAN